MQTHDPRSLAPAAFFAVFGVAQALAGEYQRLAARGRQEQVCRILETNARTRAANTRIRSRRVQEEADAELAQLDADMGLV